MDPPSVFLPSLKEVPSCSNDQLFNVLTLLHQIFIPEVRGSSLRRQARGNTATNTRTRAETALEAIRTDAFERSFSVQWLTRFISIYTRESSNANEDNLITEHAASILAICAGEAASGALTRTFTFQMNNIGTAQSNLSVLIRDAPFESSDTSSVGAKTWGGSCILSQLMTETPEAFGISSKLLSSQTSFHTLELGAGTGLASITYGKSLQQLKSSLQRDSASQRCDHDEPTADISVVTTDFHPSVFSNLCFNLSGNFPEQQRTINPDPEVDFPSTCAYFPTMRACLLDWAKVHEANSNPVEKEKDWIYNMVFDVILGTDIIYEDLHALWIKSCIEYFLKKPSRRMRDHEFSMTDLQGVSKKDGYPLFHLIIPLRRTHVKESQKVEAVFSYGEHVLANRQASGVHPSNVSWELAIFSQEDIICDAYADEEKEEVVYRYYRIGWM